MTTQPRLPPWADFPDYPTLSWEFIRLGKLERQIEAIWRDRADARRVHDFRQAVLDGAIRLRVTKGLKPLHLRKLVQLGVDVPQGLVDQVAKASR